ncbi:hypothetical protein [Bacillus sp. CH30_1T]|uniref:hypothetical protein n=1 Tax=Bacillus sp. CH30_1T TaxID=2604836 RepID=UPI001CAA8877|nr:hypothetical protein [Bacillus sp. CH30_1T]
MSLIMGLFLIKNELEVKANETATLLESEENLFEKNSGKNVPSNYIKANPVDIPFIKDKIIKGELTEKEAKERYKIWINPKVNLKSLPDGELSFSNIKEICNNNKFVSILSTIFIGEKVSAASSCPGSPTIYAEEGPTLVKHSNLGYEVGTKYWHEFKVWTDGSQYWASTTKMQAQYWTTDSSDYDVDHIFAISNDQKQGKFIQAI